MVSHQPYIAGRTKNTSCTGKWVSRYPGIFILLICCFFGRGFFLLQEGIVSWRLSGYILFISIKYRKVAVGLLTPGLWGYEVRWGKLCFSIKSFVFVLSLSLLYYLSITTPLTSSFGHHCYVYKLLLLDYGVSFLGTLFLSFLPY